ncbi:peptidoglycan D,D-transpeptidase FtsI family protein [Falsibacillus albus]|uniref:Penicillin-binding protein 2 n=1 Tax=Falsibacillus albus TaxID=2478915 RepID=A0A3L7K4Y3_9BACI|nr:penicillin-binding transpeptidase domain-containing protein [Falsibacillus albus]RLQ98133.1 penicillin-binding protein 2 [Falsibacillus albus]
MRTKRYYALGIGIVFGISVLIWRLSSIQLLNTENYSKHHINLIEESVAQRTQELVLNNGRGQFLDSTGKPLSYEDKNVLVLFPFLKNTTWKVDEVARILNISQAELEGSIHSATKPFIYGGKHPIELNSTQVNSINDLKIPGLFAVKKSFASKENLAEDLIGFTSKNKKVYKELYPDRKDIDIPPIGATGLQKTFDEFLLPDGEAKLIYHVDGEGKPLFGNQVKYIEPANPYYPVNIRTTIHSSLQKGMEEVLRKDNVQKGGAVLLDIETGDVLAMASMPDRNPSDPYKNHGSVNYMLTQETPGSVFKTVVAAAAIEKGLVTSEETFPCDLDLYGKPAKRNLGTLNFEESFSQSCNRTFGGLANRVMDNDQGAIESFAEKLGLIGDIGWHGDIYHLSDFHQLAMDNGRIFISESNKKDHNFVAQTGIGQKDVSVTPLGVANMMATIARGGEKKMAKVVSAIEYQNGTNMIDFPSKQAEGEVISPFTAMKLQQLLRKVVTGNKGTGKSFQTLPVQVSGKSGTAQTGNGDSYNKWFAGYFPYDKPKYSLVVVNLGVKENEGGINPIFSDLVQMIYDQSSKGVLEALSNEKKM